MLCLPATAHAAPNGQSNLVHHSHATPPHACLACRPLRRRGWDHGLPTCLCQQWAARPLAWPTGALTQICMRCHAHAMPRVRACTQPPQPTPCKPCRPRNTTVLRCPCCCSLVAAEVLIAPGMPSCTARAGMLMPVRAAWGCLRAMPAHVCVHALHARSAWGGHAPCCRALRGTRALHWRARTACAARPCPPCPARPCTPRQVIKSLALESGSSPKSGRRKMGAFLVHSQMQASSCASSLFMTGEAPSGCSEGGIKAAKHAWCLLCTASNVLSCCPTRAHAPTHARARARNRTRAQAPPRTCCP